MSVPTGAGRESERSGTDLSRDERSPARPERELERHRQELTRFCVRILRLRASEAAELLGRYLDALGRDDVRGLVSVITEDVGRSSLAGVAAA